MMPDRIQITHQPRTMTTPSIRTVLERLVELDKRIEWVRFDVIPGIEIDNWIDAMDAARAALKATPEERRPTDEDLYDLAAEFNGDPVPAMRRALELWGNPLQGAPATGENLAAVPREADMDHVEQLAAIIQRVDGNNSLGAAALAEAILGRYPCAFLVDPLDTPPAPEDLATDQLVAASLSALLIKECGLHSPGSSTHDLLQRAAAMLVNYGLPARPAIPPAPEPVAWCRSDEFANSMNRGCSFNGWRDPGAGANKCDMRLYAIPLPARSQ